MTSIPADGSVASPRRWLGRAGRWTPRGAIGWSLVAMALPKCPACIAGYLSLCGLGLGVGSVLAGAMRPACIGLAVLAGVMFLRRRLAAASCPSVSCSRAGPSTSG